LSGGELLKIRLAKTYLALILIGLIALVALGSGFPVTVTDDRGQEITVPTRPERIVVAGTSLYIEILLDIGAGERLVGVASSPDNPPEVTALPQVGPAFSPSVEAILALDPDLVLGAWGAVREQLERAGIIVLTTGMIGKIPDIFATIRTIGATVGEAEQAERLIGQIAEEVVGLESAVLGREPVRAAFLYVMAPDTSPYAAGSGSIENELILRAGGINSFADVSGFPQVSLEEVLARNPQVIFTDPSQVANVLGSGLLRTVSAVRDGRVFGIKASATTSTRVAEMLRTMAEFLHPEAFK
jgi:iron complex transport system substrate-binding protein